MTNNIAMYPGTFDPVTNGHVDIIERGARLFDQVIVAIADSRRKAPLFTLEERVDLAKGSIAHLDNVVVLGFDSLLIDFAKQNHANVILRGLRAVSDFDYEFQLAGMNNALDDRIETLFLPASQSHTYLSSSLIREISTLDGQVDRFVPKHVYQALLDKRLKI